MINTAFDLSGKSAVITGGNGGIGLGIAVGLAEAGADILVAARNKAKTDAAVKQLQALGVRAVGTTTNVQHEDEVADMVKLALDEFGSLDILVNNAGIGIRKAPQDYTLEDWNLIMDINLTGTFLPCREAYPHMGGGRRRKDYQHWLDDLHLRARPGDAIFSQQGRRGATDQEPCDGVGEGQHTGQLDTAGLDRDRPDRAACELRRASANGTSLFRRASRTDAGERPTTWRARRCSSPHPHPTMLQACQFRWTADM